MVVKVVILAAGQGKRMVSSLPKVLHTLAGQPLLGHVIKTALKISTISPIVVYGYQGDKVQASFQKEPIKWREQKEQLGTGHAVLTALPDIADDDQVLVLYGDVPLISENTLKKLIANTPQHEIGMVVAHFDDPKGYGRIKRDSQNKLCGIVEEKDATAKELAICEINPGIYLFPAEYLKKSLPNITQNNTQKEYYLTDCIGKAVQEHREIYTIEPLFNEEVMGVNDRKQLAELERFYQRQTADQLLQQGVMLYDPARLDIRGDVNIGVDVTIDINVILEGSVTIGDGCLIGPNCVLRNVNLGERVEVKANSVLDGAVIAADSIIGPFARVRPGTVLEPGTHIGNFVEVKNSTIGAGTKINHLSYVGDSEIGKQVNIGAGTITCNYDGANKHKTIIGDHTHIGSDTQLVAPVTIGAGATIGAGSTITKDVPANYLTLTHRIEQRTIKDWQRPEKKE